MGEEPAELGCALARLVPHSEYFTGVPPLPARDEVLAISRFAYIRSEHELVLASPLGHAHLVLVDGDALRVYHALCRGASLDELARTLAIAPGELDAFVRLLLAAAILDRGDGESDALRQWQFHDLLLHAESRLGRNTGPLGGTYRFIEELQPPDAVKEPSWGGAMIELAVPAADDAYGAVTFAQAVENRRSQRVQGTEPITLRTLGDFLYRTARVIAKQSTPWPREFPFGGEYTRRPYPNGGSRYELEVYVTANRCHDLDRGCYYYDPLHHRLATVSAPDPGVEQLLADAARASGGTDTQLLITIASRFQRSSWKYQGLALALQLKNVGVLLAHMCLTASAMDLAACPLGGGNSDLFSRVAGLDYLVESSIGELMLGSRPAS